MLMPSLSRYMSRQPWTIRKDATIEQAHAMMREHQVRHLPVLEAGKLVGIVSERDLNVIEQIANAKPEKIAVEEAMVVDVYAAIADDPVDVIVEKMAERKCGSVVVLNRRGTVEGIFTTVDALQVLADLLRRATA